MHVPFKFSYSFCSRVKQHLGNLESGSHIGQVSVPLFCAMCTGVPTLPVSLWLWKNMCKYSLSNSVEINMSVYIIWASVRGKKFSISVILISSNFLPDSYMLWWLKCWIYGYIMVYMGNIITESPLICFVGDKHFLF